MSLLLDALKKAAADKEKAGDAADVDKQMSGDTDSAKEQKSADDELPVIDEDAIINNSDSIAEEESAEELITSPVETISDANENEEEIELELNEEFDLEESVHSSDEQKADAETFDEVVHETEAADTAEANAVIESQQIAEPESDQQQTLNDNEQTIEKAQSETMRAYAPTQSATQTQADELPAYNHNDARKILEVSQKRYRNNQRIVYYGMYVFAALLFFVGSYLYYTAESLDNSSRPQFKPQLSSAKIQRNEKEEKAVVDKSVKPVNVATVEQEKETNTKAEASKASVTKAAPEKKQTITIVKQKKPDPISVLLQKAYQSYQASEFEKADNLYRKVLARDTKQRDALLGVAAIAVIEQRYPQAKSLYQKILHLYPNDTVARSAMVDLLKKEISVANESELKQLLRDNPDAAHIHFSLGLLYARQGKVNQSQQAFFDAFALEKKADYAFNLAIMLDRMNQKKAALSYYKKASGLADKQIINFDEKLLLERIEQLEAGNG